VRALGIIFMAAVVLTGCVPRRFTMAVESEPPGARVFWMAGADEQSAKTKNYIGTTPCSWSDECEGDGTFKSQGIFMYSSFVPPVVVVMAEPPTNSAALFPKREVFHCNTPFRKGERIPEKLFFDLREPAANH